MWVSHTNRTLAVRLMTVKMSGKTVDEDDNDCATALEGSTQSRICACTSLERVQYGFMPADMCVHRCQSFEHEPQGHPGQPVLQLTHCHF